MVLHIHDQMQEAIVTGTAYQTILSPPPADPSVAHPASEALSEYPLTSTCVRTTMNIDNELHRAERFLNAFNAIDKHMRDAVQANHKVSFSPVLSQFAH